MKYTNPAFALERIRVLEAELASADPTRAARLTKEIVRLKSIAFRGE